METVTIKIKTEKDLKKFYSWFRIYKIIYQKKNLKLEVSPSINKDITEQLKSLEIAFNIKDKNERLNYLYDEICHYEDQFFIQKNICEFDEKGHCFVQREYHHPSKINGCCGLCTYLGKKGCSINSIACKTFYCHYVIKKHHIPSIKKNLLFKYFFSIPQKYEALTNFWNTKEENIKIMKKNNLLYSLLKKQKTMKRW